ncbi:putative ddt domain protein [Phaeomoniella chlamydospora]|uniref:Putative ddt domain protein n=1 Tax=Phaeomoniella chlamydospora TaxID=158046 RepID=A0A0G2EN72_PHACM|nr:putative ddt domain protein [Phaeomoniella chlamydospora]
MVLFKRKPVQFLPQPPIQDDNSEASLIVFRRIDFYKQKKFICEITGHSGLTFFDALKSETNGSKEVDSAFPEPLKAPVLRRVQFSTTSRIDHLVDEVYDAFKADFYPGEIVSVLMEDGTTRMNGMVKEKAKFPAILRADGSVYRKGVSRYSVKLDSDFGEMQHVTEDDLQRDRKAFTKMMLRSFIKNTVTREAWFGAPWLVKPKIAQEYRIDTAVPLHLQHSHKLAERKALAAAARKSANAINNDQQSNFQMWSHPKGLPALKPAVKKSKPKIIPADQLGLQEQLVQYKKALDANPQLAAQMGQDGIDPFVHFNHGPWPIPLPVTTPQEPPAPPPPPPIKYPIEDLDVAPAGEGAKQRPAMKYMSEDVPVPDVACEGPELGIKMESMGPLLETWNTLNVYSQVYQLDSFTFDDFVEAMRYSSSEVECELFVEIHCGVLKLLVKSENDQDGAVQISLPDLPGDSEDEDDNSEEEDSRLPTPTPEPEPERRTTRSSLAKAEAQAVKTEADRSKSPSVVAAPHRAAEMFTTYGWIDRLRKRDFKDGGWQMIMIGLIHQIAGRPRMQAVCEELLKYLAPLDAEPTQETARLQYATMDINLRVKVLQIACMLSIETNAIKNHMEECASLMTQHRKNKIEHQRARKLAMEELRALHEVRKALAPEKSPTPPPVLEDPAEVTIDDSEKDSEDDSPLPARSLRRGTDREAERKRKRDEEEERKKREEEAKRSKGSKEYLKTLKKIDQEEDKIRKAEEEILQIDEELRQLDCPRTRVLGKDRFCNRYYWFERNAMSPEGNSDSSTADAEYANGRVWVQGPDDLEREGFIDVPKDLEQEYLRVFGMTPKERKQLEEGPTSIFTAHQWGFYEDPESIDKLIDWLDSRGNRELKLSKELQSQKDLISKYMENRKKYLASHDESHKRARVPPRKTTLASQTYYRCQRWVNNTALTENGHRHYDPPPPPRGKARKKDVTDHSVGTRVTNKQGKPLTRQGTRYNF